MSAWCGLDVFIFLFVMVLVGMLIAPAIGD